MDAESHVDRPPPLPQITLRGLLFANSIVGVCASLLATLGLGELWAGWLFLFAGAAALLFTLQWCLIWVLWRTFASEPDDPRDA